jgi:carbonic anhydrase/acetyltransferase-like protein (isoleucine patch superfamily)
MVIPDDMLAVGVPARIAGEVTGGAKRWVQTNPQVYRDLALRHAAGARLISEAGRGPVSGGSRARESPA